MSKLILVYAHGGVANDPGVVSSRFDTTEQKWIKEFYDNFLIPELQNKKLEFATVQQTTWNNIDTQVNNVTKVGDLALSCHLNAAENKDANGIETFHAGSTNGERWANLINKAVVDTLGLRDRGLKKITRDDRGGRLVVGTRPPCILTELFFLPYSSDYVTGTAKRKELALAIVKAYEDFRAGNF